MSRILELAGTENGHRSNDGFETQNNDAIMQIKETTVEVKEEIDPKMNSSGCLDKENDLDGKKCTDVTEREKCVRYPGTVFVTL